MSHNRLKSGEPNQIKMLNGAIEEHLQKIQDAVDYFETTIESIDLEKESEQLRKVYKKTSDDWEQLQKTTPSLKRLKSFAAEVAATLFDIKNQIENYSVSHHHLSPEELDSRRKKLKETLDVVTKKVKEELAKDPNFQAQLQAHRTAQSPTPSEPPQPSSPRPKLKRNNAMRVTLFNESTEISRNTRDSTSEKKREDSDKDKGTEKKRY